MKVQYAFLKQIVDNFIVPNTKIKTRFNVFYRLLTNVFNVGIEKLN